LPDVGLEDVEPVSTGYDRAEESKENKKQQEAAAAPTYASPAEAKRVLQPIEKPAKEQ
jgi:hypothetical protein